MAQQAGDDAGPIVGEGVVQKIDIVNSSIIISGFEFVIAQGAPVQIAGSTSSIAGLLPGMKVSYFAEPIAQAQDRILAIEQLPDNFPILEH